MRIQFDQRSKEGFVRLAGIYEAEFAHEGENDASSAIAVESSWQRAITVTVVNDLPAFLSSRGFDFHVLED